MEVAVLLFEDFETLDVFGPEFDHLRDPLLNKRLRHGIYPLLHLFITFFTGFCYAKTVRLGLVNVKISTHVYSVFILSTGFALAV